MSTNPDRIEPFGMGITWPINAPLRRIATKLRIRDFGGIRQADIELAPLTILLGKNNTGKSYISTAMWGLFSSPWRGGRNVKPLKAPSWFLEYTSAAHVEKRDAMRVDADQINPILNAWLNEYKDVLVQDWLTLPTASIGELSVVLEGSLHIRPQIKLPDWMNNESFFRDRITKTWSVSWSDDQDASNEVSGMFHVGTSDDTSYDDELFWSIIDKLFTARIEAQRTTPVYFPAARTGLVLAMRDLYSSVMDSFGLPSENAERTQLSRPVISFLRHLTLASGRGSKQRLSSVADFLENSVLHGHVDISEDRIPSLTYVPNGYTDDGLPMHAVSSMVTELAPLITILRHAYFDGPMIIEEPEAHLHLAAQRQIAIAMSAIVRSGTHIIASTHSDTLVQQLNILIQKYDIRQEGGADGVDVQGDEILDRREIVAYEFNIVDAKTNVVPAEIGDLGIIAESLNQIIEDLTEDVLALSASA